MQAADNSLGAIKAYWFEKLEGVLDPDELQNIFFLCVEHFFKWNKVEAKMKLQKRLSESEILKFRHVAERLKNQEPIQYILNHAFFYHLDFYVANGVLIPRPETEELVDWLIKAEKDATVLDIGTGSGCIAVSLAKFGKNLNVHALDVSEDALKIAHQNIQNNQVKVNLFQLDILTKPIPQKYDVIVSNPPYIPESEALKMMPNVLEHEPKLALFVPNEHPLLFYKAIAQQALQHLNPKGKLYFEIHEDHATTCEKMLLDLGFTNIKIQKDLQGKNRMIKAFLREK